MAIGRPKIKVDKAQLLKLCEIRCSLAEVAYYFGCSEDTIERRAKRYYGVTFAELRKQCKQASKIAVRKAFFKRALGGSDKLLIKLIDMIGLADPEDDSSDVSELDRNMIDNIPTITELTDPQTASQIYKEIIRRTKDVGK